MEEFRLCGPETDALFSMKLVDSHLRKIKKRIFQKVNCEGDYVIVNRGKSIVTQLQQSISQELTRMKTWQM